MQQQLDSDELLPSNSMAKKEQSRLKTKTIDFTVLSPELSRKLATKESVSFCINGKLAFYLFVDDTNLLSAELRT